MTQEFDAVIERDSEGYYVASVPSSLRGCHTQARSLDQLMERVKEAIFSRGGQAPSRSEDRVVAEVVWSPRAYADIHSIGDYYAQTAPGYAEVLLRRLTSVVERLEAFPT